MLKGKWWEIYQDPRLNQLEERIATNNVQLKQAVETYLAARDTVAEARANFYPTVSAGAAVSRNKVAPNAAAGAKYRGHAVQHVPACMGRPAGSRISLGVSGAAWSRRAPMRRLHAAEMANVDLALQAEMATDYFELRGLDSQIKLLTGYGCRPAGAARFDQAATEGRRGHSRGRSPGRDAA